MKSWAKIIGVTMTKNVSLENSTKAEIKEPHKSELFDNPAVKAMPMYIVIGGLLGLAFGIFVKSIAKKSRQKQSKARNQRKSKKR